MANPRAVALGDQVHAEILDRALAAVREDFAREGQPLPDDYRVFVEIGIAAGTQLATEVFIERGWFRRV